MKCYVEAAHSVMELVFFILTSTILTHSTSFKHPDMNYPGLNAASISLKNPGMSSLTKKNSSKGFGKVTSG
jgi:hypothetical protein